jgi:hypothetical protein
MQTPGMRLGCDQPNHNPLLENGIYSTHHALLVTIFFEE